MISEILVGVLSLLTTITTPFSLMANMIWQSQGIVNAVLNIFKFAISLFKFFGA